jgi:superfamily II DNA or RNA helicase
MIMSDEQACIIDKIKLGKNIKTIACPGAGKTTLAIFVSKELPTKDIMLLTYNRELSDNTKHRIKQNDLQFS